MPANPSWSAWWLGAGRISASSGVAGVVGAPAGVDGSGDDGPAGETVDPEWGIVDPGAGERFPRQALDLATNADPPLGPR